MFLREFLREFLRSFVSYNKQQTIMEYIIGRISRETDTGANPETEMETDMEMDIVMEKDKETETERGKVEKGTSGRWHHKHTCFENCSTDRLIFYIII